MDNSVTILRRHGIEHAAVAAGGDSHVMGSRGDRPWTIGIRGTDVSVLVDQTTQAVLAMIAAGAVVMAVKGLTLAKQDQFGVDLQGIGFDVRAGEVVGIAGVSGNGQQELMAALSGEENADEMRRSGNSVAFLSNNNGGVLGGISTGQDIEVSIAVKPTSSILIPRETIDSEGHTTEVITKGRHDPCVGIRGTPVVEAMMALVLAAPMAMVATPGMKKGWLNTALPIRVEPVSSISTAASSDCW